MSENNELIPKWREWLNQLFSENENPAEDGSAQERVRFAAEELDAQTFSIIASVLKLREMAARDIMIPRNRMVAIGLNEPVEDVLQTMLSAPQHSRFPVFSADTSDIKGIVHAKDVLQWVDPKRDLSDFNLRDLMREEFVVHKEMDLLRLLQTFKEKKNHMAIVKNEYGDVVGLVTIEDVLEEIVGDIQDEHDTDREEELIEWHEDGSFAIDGTVPVVEFNRSVEAKCEFPNGDFVAFSNDEFDTMNGVLVNEFKRIPALAEEIQMQGFSFRVVEADDRRVKQFHVRRIDA